MILVDVKNKYLFKSKKKGKITKRMQDNQIHTYAAYVHKDENKKKELRFVPLTHIWKLDKKRWKEHKKNHILVEHFDKNELTANTWQGLYGVPSGVENSYFATDVSGNPLSIKNPNVVFVGKEIDENKAKNIKGFVFRRFEKGLYVDREKNKKSSKK